jgi:hypothetical protein
MKRFGGKAFERRVRKLSTQPKPGHVIYQWIREDRISPNDLEYILKNLIDNQLC